VDEFPEFVGGVGTGVAEVEFGGEDGIGGGVFDVEGELLTCDVEELNGGGSPGQNNRSGSKGLTVVGRALAKDSSSKDC
jgi:hypothetical protein